MLKSSMNEPAPVVTDRVSEDGRLGELELLLHHGLGVLALECAVHKLWGDRVRPDHVPGDTG